MSWIFTTDGNYVNFNGGGNLWRLHKDSNCISWHWDESGDLFFDVYDQEYSVKAENIADVIIDGTPLSAASDFPTAIKRMFGPYLVYTALLSPDTIPIPTVKENTLGGTPEFSEEEPGVYRLTLAGAFPIGRTVIKPFGNNSTSWISIDDGNIMNYAGYNITRFNDDVLQIFFRKQSDLSLLAFGDLINGNILVDVIVFAE